MWGTLTFLLLSFHETIGQASSYRGVKGNARLIREVNKLIRCRSKSSQKTLRLGGDVQQFDNLGLGSLSQLLTAPFHCL